MLTLLHVVPMHHTSVVVYTKILEAPCECDLAKTGSARPVPLPLIIVIVCDFVYSLYNMLLSN